MSLTPGTRIGHYDIVAELGRGGMGEVYRATDTQLNREVALKILPEAFTSDPERLGRFRREAQVLASLNHPHICIIYGVGEAVRPGPPVSADAPHASSLGPRPQEVHFLAMEFVDGEDLAARLLRGPLPLDEALPIARQIAEALEAAHEQGIVHRDLKPANIKVRPDGTVKVLDFGLAKAMAADSGVSGADPSNSPTLTMRQTQMGLIIGTAAYMAPEQAKGKAVDRRADIWAFGVVLYEMLTGRRGYEAEDISETLAAVLTREVDWTKLPPETPTRLRTLLRDCLVRDPKQRLRDMGEARRVLDQLASGAPEGSVIGLPAPPLAAPAPPPAPARTWTRFLPWGIAAAAVVAAAVAAWRLVTVAPPPAGPVIHSRSILKDVSVLIDVSRDGTEIAYATSTKESGVGIILRRLDQLDGRLVAGTEGGLFPHFSPAGDWILFNADGKLKKVQTTGGPAITLCDGDLTNGAAWGDDDTIVFSGPKGLLRVPASGGTPQPLLTLAAGETLQSRPQFLPDGRHLLFTVTSKSPDSPQFAVLDVQKGTYRIVAKGGDNGQYIATGHLTCVRNGTLFALPFDLGTLTPTGAEAPVVESVSTLGPPGTGDYGVSTNGVLVYSQTLTEAGTLLTWRDRKGDVTPLPGDMRRLWGTGRLSPDGHRVANAIQSENGWDLWVVDLTRGTLTRLTFGGTNDLPVWTPDGRALIYAGAANGKAGLFRVLADGTGKPEVLLELPTPTPNCVTPDGRFVVFSEPAPNGKSRIMKLALEGAGPPAPQVVYESAASNADGQVSTDGQWLAFTSNETGRPEVYVMPFPGPGPKVQVSTGGGQRPRWAKSGRELFYWTATAGNASLMSVALQTSPLTVGAPQSLFSAFSGTTFDPAPDGQHFLVEMVGDANTGAIFVTVSNWFAELRRLAPAKK